MDRRSFVALALAAGCSRGGGITVGAKNFIEQDILGEILSLWLERRLSIPVARKLHLGGSFLAHQALVAGEISLYPEYSGTALTACLKLPLERGREAVMRAVKAAYAERYQVEWGWPLGFSNTFAMVVRRDAGVGTLSEAAARFPAWRLGCGYEFEARPDGWEAFRKVYPFQGGKVSTMDLGLLYRALRAGDVDFVAGNSTDAALSLPDFVMLRDDREFFPPYDTCLAVRADALARTPPLRAALDALTGKIPLAVMRNLNSLAVDSGKGVQQIAADFIQSLTA
jgi:glycine betaine/choline ABC-type transport system substrate-binding protein